VNTLESVLKPALGYPRKPLRRLVLYGWNYWFVAVFEADLVHPKKTAVVVIDLQHDFCSRKGAVCSRRGEVSKKARLGFDPRPIQAMLPRLEKFLEQARNAGVPVIFVRMNEYLGTMAPNVQRKKRDAEVKSCCVPGTPGFEYYKLKPQQGDHEVIKNSYDALSSPDLRRLLRKKKIENLIFTGAYTNFCVDSSVRSALTRGYHVIVPKNLVATVREWKAHHTSSIWNWSALFAHVVKPQEIVAAWLKTGS